MRNLQIVAQECMNDLDRIGVEYGHVDSFEINTRAHNRWGQCKRRPNGTYSININADLLDERNSIDGLKNTIYHELCHTCEGCMNHGTEWKRQAEKVHKHLGYDITRCSTAEEKGVIYHTEVKRNKEYIVKCPHCGQEYKFSRMCKTVQHPEWYRCGVCHHDLIRIK